MHKEQRTLRLHRMFSVMFANLGDNKDRCHLLEVLQAKFLKVNPTERQIEPWGSGPIPQ